MALCGNLQGMSHDVAIESKLFKRMQHVSEGLLPFSCYVLLRFKDAEGKTRKSWEIPNIPTQSQTFPKHSQSESFHQHPPTSTNPTKQPQCHEYPQVAHSLTQSPWVPQACRCRSPLQPDENEQFAEPLA